MNHSLRFFRLFTFFLLVSLVLLGCGLMQLNEGGVLREETHSVGADSAESVKVDIEMGMGVLNISSSSTDLMEGTFKYNVTEWKPQVVYEVNGSEGALLINQPDSEKLSGLVKNGENTWDLRLGEAVPLDLDIEVGAGESEIDLTGIDLTQLDIDTGVGELDLDLRGNWDHDVNIAIKGGIGEITLHLPADIGARVEVKNGLGNVNREGLAKDGNAFVNESYGKSPYTLYIKIDNGTGNVNLEA